MNKEDLIIGNKYVDPEDGEVVELLAISTCGQYVIYKWFDIWATDVQDFVSAYAPQNTWSTTQHLKTKIAQLECDIKEQQKLLTTYKQDLLTIHKNELEGSTEQW